MRSPLPKYLPIIAVLFCSTIVLHAQDLVWRRSSTKIDSLMLSMTVGNDGSIYVGTAGSGVWMSTDGGVTFEQVNDSLTNKHVSSLAVDPITGDLWAGTNLGLFRATTGSPIVWQQILPDRLGREITFSPRGLIYAFTCNHIDCGLRLFDGAWKSIGLREQIRAIAVARDGKVYASTGNGFYSSIEEGYRWQLSSQEAPSLSDLAVADDGTLFGSSNDVFRSTNGGRTWDTVYDYFASIWSIAISSNGSIYAATFNVVIVSTDNGTTWQSLTRGDYPRQPIVVGTGPDGEAYAGDYYGFFYRLEISSDVEQDAASTGAALSVRSTPNPFSEATHLSITIPLAGETRLDLVDARGTAVRTLIAGTMEPGAHVIVLDEPALPAGTYFLMLRHADRTVVERIVIER